MIGPATRRMTCLSACAVESISFPGGISACLSGDPVFVVQTVFFDESIRSS